MEALIPERFRERHPLHRAAISREPRTRSMAAGLEPFALRGDGTEFPAAIGLSSIKTEDGVLAMASKIWVHLA